ncbi:MAG: hypothetical protein ACE5HI_12725 [bacterium]
MATKALDVSEILTYMEQLSKLEKLHILKRIIERIEQEEEESLMNIEESDYEINENIDLENIAKLQECSLQIAKSVFSESGWEDDEGTEDRINSIRKEMESWQYPKW